MAVLEALLLTLLFIASVLSVLPWLTRQSKATEAAPQRAPGSRSNTPKVAMRGGEEEMKQVFGAFDKNKNGFITKEELGESLRQMGISAGEDDDEVGRMVERLDSNGDGLIDLDEFSGIFDTTDHHIHRDDHQEEELREAFGVFDGDKDGLITVEELGAVLAAMGMKEGEREESCREMIRKVDLDGDGMVSFDEFKRMMATTMTKSSNGGGGGVVRIAPAF